MEVWATSRFLFPCWSATSAAPTRGLPCNASRAPRSATPSISRPGIMPGSQRRSKRPFPNSACVPRSVIACGAGPVVERKLKLTNALWLMDGPDIARRLDLGQGLLLNDFEAQALSLPTIPERWARRIGPLAFGAVGPQLILGPGTGLGVGALVEAAGRHTPLSSEACHMDFGPVTPEDWAIWPHLERAHGRITSESVISGPGLVRVHRARMASLGAASPALDGPQLVAAALAKRAGDEAKSLGLFWRIVGRFAGDMAVAFVAFGGVTLAGGVLPRLSNFSTKRRSGRRSRPKRRSTLWPGGFRRAWSRMLDSVLIGMAAIAETAAKLRHRLWRARLAMSESRFAAFSPLSCGGVAREMESRL